MKRKSKHLSTGSYETGYLRSSQGGFPLLTQLQALQSLSFLPFFGFVLLILGSLGFLGLLSSPCGCTDSSNSPMMTKMQIARTNFESILNYSQMTEFLFTFILKKLILYWLLLRGLIRMYQMN